MDLRQIPVYPRPYLDKIDRRKLTGELLPLDNLLLQRRAYGDRWGGWCLSQSNVAEQKSHAERYDAVSHGDPRYKSRSKPIFRPNMHGTASPIVEPSAITLTRAVA